MPLSRAARGWQRGASLASAGFYLLKTARIHRQQTDRGTVDGAGRLQAALGGKLKVKMRTGGVARAAQLSEFLPGLHQAAQRRRMELVEAGRLRIHATGGLVFRSLV